MDRRVTRRLPKWIRRCKQKTNKTTPLRPALIGIEPYYNNKLNFQATQAAVEHDAYGFYCAMRARTRMIITNTWFELQHDDERVTLSIQRT